ncbi:IS66 family transposase, partial [Martelella mediterranea]|uniref:IS66 family transposase n=1 Tax=Martelella mediterranea TaxID=293089 RepID=UPI001E568D36
ETTIPVIQRGRGQVKRCYGWAVKRDHTRWCGNEPPAIVYVFKESRAGYNAVEILEGFSGHLHVDGYAGYNRLTEEDRPEGPVGLIYCWTHVRRRFERVIEKDGSRAAEAIKEMIDNLNNIENKFKGQSPTARLEARTRKSKPIVDRIFRKCESLVHQIPERSNLRKEINYTLNLREGLTKFLEDGRFDFDNNLVENSIRKIAIGRNNFMFAGSIKGAEVWLAMTSICETCRLNRVSPELYFGWVLGSINEDVIKLLEQDTLSKRQERELLKFFNKLLPWNCPVGRY